MLSNQIALFLLQLVGMTVLFLTSLLTLAFLFYRHRDATSEHCYPTQGGSVSWQAINAIYTQ